MKRLGLVLGLLLASAESHAEPTARFEDLPAKDPPTAKAAPRAAPQPGARFGPPAGQRENWARSAARERVRRAEALVGRGEPLPALLEYAEAIRLDPSFGDAYLGLGALHEAAGDLREAERVYDVAARLPPSRAAVLEKRARVRRALGRQDEAFRDLETSVSLEPIQGRLEALAEWYVERHAWTAALLSWRRILSLTSGESSARNEARLRVKALSILAADSDPVTAGGEGAGWVRRSLAAIARRAP